MADMTSMEPGIKRLYPDEMLEFMALSDRPIQGILSKSERFGGNDLKIPIMYSDAEGGCATFATAQNNVTDSNWAGFNLTRKRQYQMAHIDAETAEATLDDEYAFVSAMQNEINSALNAVANKVESLLPLGGTGSFGQIGSGQAGATITLSDIRDIFKFEKGMTLVVSATDGGAIRTGSEKVNKINRIDGTLGSTSATWATVITAIAASDYLSVQGTAQHAGTKLCMDGFASWFPATAPSAGESYYGQDRSLDSRLWGTYHNGANQKIEEALIDGQSACAANEGKPTKALMNHVWYRALIKELGSKKEYSRDLGSKVSAQGAKGAMADIGYDAIKVHGVYGSIDVVSTPKVQAAICWLLDPKTCHLVTLKKSVRIDDLDGNRVLRRSAADGVECRVVHRGNFGSSAPARNGHVALKAIS